ncbi:probable MFS transporter [Cephalotrichum gorgonifer]|uniref:Probable MFS transporter n=1 Tax=Cephalotrichum gorgonifer TaxID=2041049 RepID=A0AAE8N2G6_9PEZI|nr:probable MFS transporter [Cephalotrichum gorgonifer]
MERPVPKRSSSSQANVAKKSDPPAKAPAIDPEAERRVRKKIDLMIMPIICILYLFCFIDRANIGNARLAGLEKDLGMKGYDYNATLSVFYISYILCEIPSNVLCKLVGPGWFLPILTILFGSCSLANGFVKTVPQAMAVRFLLGIFEAGMFPGIAYYLSRWYRRSELTFRLACYVTASPLAGAFGALLASAILTMDSIGGSIHRWRMIFVIEGLVTIGLGIIGLVILTDSPATARWLTPDEKELAESRVRSERVGQSKVLDKIDKVKLIKGVTSPVTISLAAMFFFVNITVQGFSVFAPTIIGTLFSEKTTIQKQLLTAPPYLLGSIFTLVLPFLSWRMDTRQIFMILGAPTGIIGYIIFLATDKDDATVRYFATFLIASAVSSYGAFCSGQASANVVSDTARSSAIGFMVMVGNLGGLVSTWSFLPMDAPNYPIGNGLNLASQASILAIAVGMMFWMKRDNRRRDERHEEAEAEAKLREMSKSEIEDLDWQHPYFRWQI